MYNKFLTVLSVVAICLTFDPSLSVYFTTLLCVIIALFIIPLIIMERIYEDDVFPEENSKLPAEKSDNWRW